jgi:hypothetical protein
LSEKEVRTRVDQCRGEKTRRDEVRGGERVAREIVFRKTEARGREDARMRGCEDARTRGREDVRT